MVLQWTTSANRDLVRLHAFLNPLAPRAAAQIVQQLVAAAEQLLTYPQLFCASGIVGKIDEQYLAAVCRASLIFPHLPFQP